MRDREQDHRNWLAELEACVREHRPFGMARDPHQCKFGLWYDRYKTEDRRLKTHQTILLLSDAFFSSSVAAN
jgi:hypothetical protein